MIKLNIQKKKKKVGNIINNRFILNNAHNSENKKLNKKYKEILEYTDKELNSLIYQDALMKDKRSFFQYYLSLLRANHLLLFSFYSFHNDYNSQIIKIFLFFFFFAVHFTINALFFNDNTMHKIYTDEGDFNFIYQIPKIIYSSLISAVISIFIKYLSLSEKNIIEIKSEKNKEKFEEKYNNLIRIIKIKFALFFIFAFFLLGFFAYYITCFCGVYVNTQIHLIKDSVISFGISLLYPFGIYSVPTFFRLHALKDEKKNKQYLYKFSQFIASL